MDIDFYRRFVSERLDALRVAFTRVLEVLPENESQQKVAAINECLQLIELFTQAISVSDRPQWLDKLRQALERYTQRLGQPSESYRLLRTLISVSEQVNTHSWDTPAEFGVDFEAVFIRYVEESRLNELFDEMIASIEEIVASGQVDSTRASRALEQVIATLRRNARSGFHARSGAWKASYAFLKNFAWESFSEIPGLGAAVRAARKTMEDLNSEMERVDREAQREIELIAATQGRRLLGSGEQLRLGSGIQEATPDPDDPTE